jgi:hypothetical protein
VVTVTHGIPITEIEIVWYLGLFTWPICLGALGGWGGVEMGGVSAPFRCFTSFIVLNTLSILGVSYSGESLSANLLLRWRERGDSMEHGVGGESTLHPVLKVRLSRQSILYMPEESRPMPIYTMGGRVSQRQNR